MRGLSRSRYYFGVGVAVTWDISMKQDLSRPGGLCEAGRFWGWGILLGQGISVRLVLWGRGCLRELRSLRVRVFVDWGSSRGQDYAVGQDISETGCL